MLFRSDIRRNANGWEADVEVSPDDELSPSAQRWYRRLKRTGFGAASVGFSLDEQRAPSEDERKRHGASLRWVGTKWTLLEWSVVAVGADPAALMTKSSDEARAFRRSMALLGFEQFMRDDEATARADAAPSSSDPVSGEVAQEEDPVLTALADLGSKVDQIIAMMEADTAAEDRKSTRLNSSHVSESRMPSSA